MKITTARLQRIYMVRTANIYRHQRDRAAKAGVTLDYDLTALRSITKEAIEADGCAYCRGLLTPLSFSIDHEQPVSRGGAHGLLNLCVCCEACNQAKGMLTEDEFHALLRLIHEWPPTARQDVVRRLRAGGKVIGRGSR